MPHIARAQSALGLARRRAALGLLRLASLLLRKGLSLYQREKISKIDLCVALSTARLLQRSAGILLRARSHAQRQSKQSSNRELEP